MTIPTCLLNDGHTIPAFGFGTWPLTNAEARAVVGDALAAGYRLIDTASRYANETGVGQAIGDADLPRDQIFLTSKIRGGDQEGDLLVRRAVDASLAALGLDYLDLELIHWPLPMLDRYVQTWRVLAELRQEGLIRSIGVSNFLPEHLDRLEAETGLIPAVNQIELHPYFPQTELRDYHAAHGIVTEAWAPLGHGRLGVLSDPVIGQIAADAGCGPAQVVLAWHLAHGIVPIPKSAHPERMRANLAACDIVLDPDQLARIDALDRAESLMESSAIHDER